MWCQAILLPRRHHEDREAAKIAKNLPFFFVVFAVFASFVMVAVALRHS
jgi:hypothetical protein